MAIPSYASANFQMLLRAAEDGNLALLECTDKATGESRYVITAVAWDGEEYQLTPFGHLATGNPFEDYVPPEEVAQ